MLIYYLFLQEFDEPHVLLNNEDSIFYSLVQQTGQVAAKQLHHIAEMVRIAQILQLELSVREDKLVSLSTIIIKQNT